MRCDWGPETRCAMGAVVGVYLWTDGFFAKRTHVRACFGSSFDIGKGTKGYERGTRTNDEARVIDGLSTCRCSCVCTLP